MFWALDDKIRGIYIKNELRVHEKLLQYTDIAERERETKNQIYRSWTVRKNSGLETDNTRVSNKMS
jgi:hypothetical protein